MGVGRVRMQGAVVDVGQAGLSNELKDILEGIGHVRSSLIVQVKVQIVQVRFQELNQSTAIKTHGSGEIRS